MHSPNLQRRKRKQRQGVKILYSKCAGVHKATFSVLWDKLCFVVFFPVKHEEKNSLLTASKAGKQQHHPWDAGKSLSYLAATPGCFCSARWSEMSGRNTQAQHKDRHFHKYIFEAPGHKCHLQRQAFWQEILPTRVKMRPSWSKYFTWLRG